jgi:hypothetical protein
MFDISRQISFITVILLSVLVCVAQQKTNQNDTKNQEISSRPFNCESNFVYLSQITDMVKAQENQNGVLIIIARLGDGENRRGLNHRRLHNVRLQLNQQFRITPDKIIVAEGESVKGIGRIEFYLKGKMIDGLLVGKNDDICVGCCGPDERFYPDKEQFERRHKQKQKKTIVKIH